MLLACEWRMLLACEWRMLLACDNLPTSEGKQDAYPTLASRMLTSHLASRRLTPPDALDQQGGGRAGVSVAAFPLAANLA